MTAVCLQARLDSVRLPRKAILMLADRTVVEHAMLALAGIEAEVHALLTDADSEAVLKPLAQACGFDVFVGSKSDVLDRYARAAEHYGVDTVVRATGDNPLVSAPLAEMILGDHRRTDAQFSAFDGPPLGTGVEVLDAEALHEASARAHDPYEREHVSPYLYRNPGLFRISRIEAPHEYCLSNSRVTLDTQADYDVLCAIYGDLYDGAPIDVLDLIDWLKAHFPELACRSSA